MKLVSITTAETIISVMTLYMQKSKYPEIGQQIYGYISTTAKYSI